MSLVLTLSPSGQIIAEHFHNGGRHTTPLQAGQVEETCRRILEAQLRSRTAIGEDGQPTAAQVRHWERHGIWKDPSCPFCIAEGLKPQKWRPRPMLVGDGSVQVRSVPQGSAKKLRAKAQRQRIQATAEELGL